MDYAATNGDSIPATAENQLYPDCYATTDSTSKEGSLIP